MTRGLGGSSRSWIVSGSFSGRWDARLLVVPSNDGLQTRKASAEIAYALWENILAFCDLNTPVMTWVCVSRPSLLPLSAVIEVYRSFVLVVVDCCTVKGLR